MTDEQLVEELEADVGKLSVKPCKTSCAYCNVSEASCLVQCLDCKRWFCNSRGSTPAAHIVSHLIYSRHKQVMLNEEGPLGETVLECYKCGCKNLFDLGFVAAKEEAVVVLFCRHPCASTRSNDDLWTGRDWQPLVEDKAIQPWLVPIPKEGELEKAKKQTLLQIKALETFWKRNRLVTAANDGNNDVLPDEPELENVVTVYNDAQHYRSVFMPLVNAEEEANVLLKEEQKLENCNVRWEVGLSQRPIATFGLVKSSYSELKVYLGETFSIKLPGNFLVDEWEGTGRVVRLPTLSNPEVSLELDATPSVAKVTSISRGFTISGVFNNVPYKRMVSALNTFVKSDRSISTFLYHKLLGFEVPPSIVNCKLPKVFRAPNLPELNHSQINAVKFALQHPLSLIQGPPGTGKTVTSATLIYHLVQQFKDDVDRGKVLVVAPSNVAVDHLTEKIRSTGLDVVRVPARSRTEISPEIQGVSLEAKTLELAKSTRKEYLTLVQLKEKYGELKPRDQKLYEKLKRALESKVIKNSEVVCCTCTTAGSSQFRNARFRALLIDEATQATEPECLIPFVTGIKQAIIVGDHQQLGPVIVSKAAAKAGFGQSMFERLIVRGIKPYRLQVQYRMHPSLSEFPSNMFYEGSLQNGVTALERTRPTVTFPFPVAGVPYMFHCNFGPEELGSNGTSYLNRTEASSVESIATEFLKQGVPPSQIGIITPYNEQRLFLMEHMCMNGPLEAEKYSAIQIESVDAFQGREKDYIILSCVRSNERQGIGFLNDPRRLNVAITRAKYGLIIVGNPRVLAQDSLWYTLIEDAQKQGVLVQGPIYRLKQVTETFSKPKRHRERGSFSRKLEVEKRDAQAHFDARAASKWAANNGDLYSRFGRDLLPGEGRGHPLYSDPSGGPFTQQDASQGTGITSLATSNFSAHLYNQYGTQSSISSSQMNGYGSQSSFASFASQAFSDYDPYSGHKYQGNDASDCESLCDT